ncbi:MAG: hypothetical protein AB7F23_06725 [Phycisphaerae bacterium]|jgi:hypothetical protein
MNKLATITFSALILLAGCGGGKIEITPPAVAPDPAAITDKLESRLANACSFAARASGKFTSPKLSGDITVNLYFDSPKTAGVEISSMLGAMAVIGSDEERLWQRSYQGDNQTCYIYPRKYADACARGSALPILNPELVMGFLQPDMIRGSRLVFHDNRWRFECYDSRGRMSYAFNPLTNLIEEIEMENGTFIRLGGYEEIAPGFEVPRDVYVRSGKMEFKLHCGKLKAFEFTDAMKQKFFTPPESDTRLTLTEDCRFE